MKRSLFFAVLILCASLASCQCAEEPDVGPVEDEEESASATQVEGPPRPLVG